MNPSSTPDTIGRYRIERELGRGGMAIVYRAYDPRFGREVAIKVLPRELLLDPTFRARFDREARIIASLEHSAIVPVYDYGEQNGQPYFVMRLMTGGSLESRLERGPVSLRTAADLISRLALALDKAHAQGIIHRDLKPGNILFDSDGWPYLSDFGIVKLREATTNLTNSGIIGTPAYMSPEQGLGKSGLDGRSDIYSLGAILFHMLSGKLPYEAETPTGQIMCHITMPVPDIRQVYSYATEELHKVISRSMAKEREDRFSTVSELAEALEQAARSTVSASTLVEPNLPLVTQLDSSSHPDVGRTDLQPVSSSPGVEVSAPSSSVYGSPQMMPAKKVGLVAIIIGMVSLSLLLICSGVAFVIFKNKSNLDTRVYAQTETGFAVASIPLSPSFTETVRPTVATVAILTSQPAFTQTPTAVPRTSTPTAPIPATLMDDQLVAGSTRRSPVDGMMMVYIPAGEFLMGSSSDPKAEDDEKPQQTVYLDAFWIDQTEVTNAMYAMCVNDGDCLSLEWRDSNTHQVYFGNPTYDGYPVIHVTYDRAVDYCRWAGKELPTEAQWEKAARGTDGRVFPWGSDYPDCDLANFGGDVDEGCLGDTSPVGSYPGGASPYGVLDMAGNVYEWVSGWYDEGYYLDMPLVNPPGASSGSYRMYRGGSWLAAWDHVRAAYRDYEIDNKGRDNVGLRCAAKP